jgi:hypothetical protein
MVEIATGLLSSPNTSAGLYATRLLMGLAGASENAPRLKAAGVVQLMANTWLEVPAELLLEYARLSFRLCAYDVLVPEICQLRLPSLAYERIAAETSAVAAGGESSGAGFPMGAGIEIMGLVSRADLNGL